MTLIILDPSLAHPHGHHLEWDLAIANAAREREQDVLIFAHKDCPVASTDGIEVVPWFSHSAYATKYQDPITGRFDDFAYFNDTLSDELALLPRDRLRATDAVLVPTLTERHLLGYVCWMKTFDPLQAPLFVVHLMFPSGLDSPDDTGRMRVGDQLQALFYRLAFRRAAEPGTRIHFFGGGRQLAREYSQLLGATVEPHPIPNCPKRQKARDAHSRPAALLFAGDAKVEKGIALLPQLADRLSQMWPDWDFLAHVNSAPAWGSALTACDELTAVAEHRPNLKLRTGRLSRGEYLSLMEDADCMVSTYDPVVYAHKSSGVVWESISLTLPLLVAAGTWPENEAKEWGAGYMTYAQWSVDGIVEAFSTLVQRLPALYGASLDAAARYHAFNGPSALLDQIGRLWVPRMLAASLIVQPQPRALPLEEVLGEGWSYPESLSGRTVRWGGKSMEIAFAWPFDVPWQLDIEIERFIGQDQVVEARALIGDEEVTASGIVNDDRQSGRLIITGTGGGRDNPNVTLRVELPWTFRPEHETRDLGLLVSGLRVSPAATEGLDANRRTIEILTPVTIVEGRGFQLTGAVSGLALVDPHRENWLFFVIQTAGGPALARAVQLFVNGAPVRLKTVASGENVWQAQAMCDPNILSVAGYHAEWDLILGAGASEAEVWISELRVSNSAAAVAASRPRNSAPLPRTEKIELAGEAADEADPAAETSRPAPSEIQTPLYAGEGLSMVSCHDVRLDEYRVERNYRHLDISLRSVSLAGGSWDHVKFKFIRQSSRKLLELRRARGWPEMFAAWPGNEEDGFGPLMLLQDPTYIEEFQLPQDQLLLQAIFSLLPAAVRASADRAGLPAEGVEEWAREAYNVAREWLQEMSRRGFGNYRAAA